MCRTQFTISAYFSDGEVTCSLNDLRIDGTLREFADWQQVQDLCALDGTQIMELKRASLLFKAHIKGTDAYEKGLKEHIRDARSGDFLVQKCTHT
jgi:hypothetical protein